MLAVIDHGLGNLRSLCAALDRMGVAYSATVDPSTIRAAQGIVLPGVGAFPDGMASLARLGLIDVLNDLVLEKKRPILGICLGFQLMARDGFEFGHEAGLRWLDASVLRLEATTVRVPHVGWNDCVRVKHSPIFDGIPDDALFYFTHSYRVVPENDDHVVAFSDHGSRFVAAVQNGNIFGTQFHPEKSQQHGLALLENFVRKVALGC